MEKTIKVYGDRTCLVCKGLIHRKGYRTRYRQRKTYFCSKGCIHQHIARKLAKFYPKGYLPTERDITKATKQFMKDNIEEVFVVRK